MSDSTSVSADSIRAASDARLAQGFYGGRPHMGTGTLEGHQAQGWTPQVPQYARRCADTAARPSAPPHVRCRGGRLALAPRVLCGSRHVAQFSLVSTELPSSLRPAQAGSLHTTRHSNHTTKAVQATSLRKGQAGGNEICSTRSALRVAAVLATRRSSVVRCAGSSHACFVIMTKWNGV